MAVTGADGSGRLGLPGLGRELDAARKAAAAARPDGVGRPEGVEAPAQPDAFGDALTKALDAVDGDVKAGDQLTNKVVRGESVEMHDLMMALEKADLSVRLMTQVGRRAVDAYREIMRLNV